ncbi:MAG TPA: T9SS type A sorting domain-containing protein [Ignavibacteriaceae bacterium]|nr:T9SS type A sorting domain-containing protein [Ignavibacteriaceae bacterium]
MNFVYMLIAAILFSNITSPIFAQDNENCFLIDFEPKNAVIPPYEDEEKPAADPTIFINVNASDTIGKISKYIFGNAIAVWIGNTVNDPVLIDYLQKLSPTLIRYPGGNWSSIFFWNGDPGNLPDSLVDGTNGQKYSFTPQYGKNSWPTALDNYYSLREQVNTQGLITINYAYARYGLGPEPVKQAAHYAADWVRYDNGRTLFWEIGNEDGGPWQAGWRIDTAKNEDGQPLIINGALYGSHFRVFADSMRAAASETGSVIFIGGQVYHNTTSWNIVDQQWNAGFFSEVGNAADFYVFHNYFGSAGNVNNILSAATTETNKNINFIRQDIINKHAAERPIALTEWNVYWDLTPNNIHRTSFINGMQSVILSCELIKLSCGMSARWLIANFESDGMFYLGNDSSIPKWNPRPDVFYMYYLQKLTGDNALTANSDNANILSYASKFNSGETGLVIVNKGTAGQVVRVNIPGQNVGDKFYVYSLTGGTDNGDFSQNVYVNGTGPAAPAWGPIEDLESIPASAYPINGEIRFTSPARSVQFILIENGNNPLSVKNESELIERFALYQNFPNPFNPNTVISFYLPEPGNVTLKIYDITGSELITLMNNELKSSGKHEISFNAENFSSGIYFYKLVTEKFSAVKSMTLLK